MDKAPEAEGAPDQLFYVGIKALFVENGRILMLKNERHSDEVYWDFPGGRIQKKEFAFPAMKREVDEELPGVTNLGFTGIAHAEVVDKEFPDGNGLFLVFMQATGDMPDELSYPDHTEAKRFSKDELIVLSNIRKPYRDAAIKAIEHAKT